MPSQPIQPLNTPVYVVNLTSLGHEELEILFINIEGVKDVKPE